MTNLIGKVKDKLKDPKNTVVGPKDDTEGTGNDSTKRYAHTNKNMFRKLFVVFPAFAILTLPLLSGIAINAQTENGSSVTAG